MGFIKKIICFIFGHKYRVAQKFNTYSRRVTCARCKDKFAMNDDVRSLLPWDCEFEGMYEDHGHEIKWNKWELK